MNTITTEYLGLKEVKDFTGKPFLAYSFKVTRKDLTTDIVNIDKFLVTSSHDPVSFVMWELEHWCN